jgi:hypothetical protein
MSTAITTLERTRASINDLIEQAAAEVEADRLEREQQSAQAIEYANSAANISAAAVKMGRRYIGVELKPEYARQAARFLEQAEGQSASLFDSALAA